MGAQTYKGIVEWEDDFDGKKNANTFATVNTDAKRVLTSLMGYAAQGTLISLEIKRVNSD
jgi:hypothetical protein